MSVSGVFLYVIGIINLVLLAGIWKVFRRMRQGDFDEAQLEEYLNNRGFLNRILSRATGAVSRPWQMYPIGLLFGLGFDTATDVGFVIVGLFVVTWAVAMLVWRYGRIEEKWAGDYVPVSAKR